MKIISIKFRLNASLSYQDDYFDRIDDLKRKIHSHERIIWLRDHKIRFEHKQATDHAAYETIHSIVSELDGALLTEYLLRFGAEPCVF